MSNIFNMDNPFFRFMGHVADIIILNLLCMVCCVPIVTIGASLTATYYVAMKKVRGEETYIVRSFFYSFKQNFKQSTVIWLIFLALGTLLAFDFQITRVMEGTLSMVLRCGLYMILFIVSIIFLYVFPVLARFYNPTKAILKNAVLMSIRHFPYTLLMLLIAIGSVLLTFLNGTTLSYGLLVWFLLGFALIILINAYFFRKIFDHYMPPEEKEIEQERPLTPEEQSLIAGITPIRKEKETPNKSGEKTPADNQQQ